MKAAYSARTLAGLATFFLASVSLRAQTADELIKKGDLHYERLEAKKALQYYLPAEKLNPDNASLLVRISREYRHLMSDASQKDDKLKLGRTAVDYSKRAVALAPDDPESQLALAISYGKILPFVGNKEKMEMSRLVKAAAEKVTKLDPKNDLGWHVLGRWHLVLAEISGGKRALAQVVYGKMPDASNEEAVRYFEKAIALNPNRLMRCSELGRTYAQMDRKEEARRLITKGLGMRETEKDDPETKEKGREILEKLR